MKAYSDDLRDRIIRAYYSDGRSYKKTAKRFYVSESFVKKLLEHHSRTGTVTPNSKLNFSPVPVFD